MLPEVLYLNDLRYEVSQMTSIIGHRCLHAAEGGFNENPVGMPNVRRALNIADPVKFTSELQELSWQLMTRMNSSISHNEWMNVFDSGTAFCNRHGVETNDPKLMDGIICGGMFTEAPVEGDYITAYPGVHAIDVRKPLPSVEQILDNGWWFVGNTGRGSQGVFNLPQGDGGPVYVLYALAAPARYPVEWFERWVSDEYPDPLRYGG